MNKTEIFDNILYTDKPNEILLSKPLDDLSLVGTPFQTHNLFEHDNEKMRIFEKILYEADDFKTKWLEIKKYLKDNSKPLPIVEYNIENYIKYLDGTIVTGYNNTSVTMETGKNGGYNLFEKLGDKSDNRNILIAGIKETLEKPLMVITDRDEKGRPAISFLKSYDYQNDYKQMCKKILKVIVTNKNIVISSYFVEYDNIREMIKNGEEILQS